MSENINEKQITTLLALKKLPSTRLNKIMHRTSIGKVFM